MVVAGRFILIAELGGHSIGLGLAATFTIIIMTAMSTIRGDDGDNNIMADY